MGEYACEKEYAWTCLFETEFHGWWETMSDREKEASVEDTRDDLNSLHLERWAQVLCVSVCKKYIYISQRTH